MISRTTLAFLTGGACGALVATLLQGPVVPASLLSDQEADGGVEQTTRAVRLEVAAPSPEGTADKVSPDEHVEELESLVEELETELHRARHGVPTLWDFEPPKGYGPDDYAATIDAIIENCPDYDGEVLAHDCSEPPCLTLYKSHGTRFGPTQCAAWSKTYTGWQTGQSGTHTCPDGREVAYNLAGPSLDVAMEGGDEAYEQRLEQDPSSLWEAPTEVPADEGNAFKRYEWRLQRHAALLCED